MKKTYTRAEQHKNLFKYFTAPVTVAALIGSFAYNRMLFLGVAGLVLVALAYSRWPKVVGGIGIAAAVVLVFVDGTKQLGVEYMTGFGVVIGMMFLLGWLDDRGEKKNRDQTR